MGDQATASITSLHYSAALDTPANKRFSAAYEKRYGRSTSLYSAGYTGARCLLEALKASTGKVEDRRSSSPPSARSRSATIRADR